MAARDQGPAPAVGAPPLLMLTAVRRYNQWEPGRGARLPWGWNGVRRGIPVLSRVWAGGRQGGLVSRGSRHTDTALGELGEDAGGQRLDCAHRHWKPLRGFRSGVGSGRPTSRDRLAFKHV